MTSQAQHFARSCAVSLNMADQLVAAKATWVGWFEENDFFDMPDGSRVIVSRPSGGYRVVRAAPAK